MMRPTTSLDAPEGAFGVEEQGMDEDFTTLIETALEGIPCCESHWRGKVADDGESGSSWIQIADGRIFRVTYERDIAPILKQ